jgi:hypothetical protein
LEEYDSKKYIDYLDVDVFPEDRQIDRKQATQDIQHATISRHQQEILLESL